MRWLIVAVLLLAAPACALTPTPTPWPATVDGCCRCATDSQGGTDPNCVNSEFPWLCADVLASSSCPSGYEYRAGEHCVDTGDVPTGSSTPQAGRCLAAVTPTPTITPTPTSTADPEPDTWITTGRLRHGISERIAVDPHDSEQACVTWDPPWRRCAVTGDHPSHACTVDADCGTSTPCTDDEYGLRGQMIDVTNVGDTTLRVHHFEPPTATRACAVVLNEDGSHAQAGVLSVVGMRLEP